MASDHSRKDDQHLAHTYCCHIKISLESNFSGYHDRRVVRATRRGQPSVGRVTVMVAGTIKLDKSTRVMEKPAARLGNSAGAAGDRATESRPGRQETLPRPRTVAPVPDTHSVTAPAPLD